MFLNTLLYSSIQAKLLYYLKRLVGGVAIAISNGLSVGVFFLQFLEWWYMSEDHQSALAATSLPIPEPPKVSCYLNSLRYYMYVTSAI